MKMFLTILLLLCGWLSRADARELVRVSSAGHGYIMSTADYCKNAAPVAVPDVPAVPVPSAVPVFTFQHAYVPSYGHAAVAPPSVQTQVVPFRTFGFGRRPVFGTHFSMSCFGTSFGGASVVPVQHKTAVVEPIGPPKEPENNPAYDAGKETNSKLNQWCVYVHDNAPVWYEQGRVWVAWHPNETLAYALGTLLVLTWLFRRRHEVNRLKTKVHDLQLELDSAEDTMQNSGGTYILSSENDARPAAGFERYGDTMLQDVLAKFAEGHEFPLRQLVAMHTEAVSRLHETQQSALDLLKIQQNNVNAVIQSACKQAIDSVNIAAKASVDASTRASADAQTKVLEVVKIAVEALKATNVEHAKAEAATVTALSTTAQKSIDGTRNLLDALTENKDQQ
jgi:hypothetical protein